jgi:hypothetical protein
MLERLPIDLIVEIGILAGPDEYEELAKTTKRNAIILQKPYIINATNAFIVEGHNGSYNGSYTCCYRGRCHSFNDQPAITWHNGTKEWYRHGIRHRDNDLPARINGIGDKVWYQNGKLHRDNGLPAIMYATGINQWYIHGNKCFCTE